MKFIDKITKLNILSSDNNIEVEDILLKSKSRVLQLSLLLDNAIGYDAYHALYRAVKDIVAPLDLKLEFSLLKKLLIKTTIPIITIVSPTYLIIFLII